jgi:hypothetical protein
LRTEIGEVLIGEIVKFEKWFWKNGKRTEMILEYNCWRTGFGDVVLEKR